MLLKLSLLAIAMVANAQEWNQGWDSSNSQPPSIQNFNLQPFPVLEELPAATHLITSSMLPAAPANEEFSAPQLPVERLTTELPYVTEFLPVLAPVETFQNIPLQSSYTEERLPVAQEFPSQSFQQLELPKEDFQRYPIKGNYPKKPSPIVQMMSQQREYYPTKGLTTELPIQQKEWVPVQQKEIITQLPLQQKEIREEFVQQEVQLPVQQEVQLPVQQVPIIQQQVQVPLVQEDLPVQQIQQQEQIITPTFERHEEVIQQQAPVVQDSLPSFPIKGQRFEQLPLPERFVQEDVQQNYEGSASTLSLATQSQGARMLNLPHGSDLVLNQPIDFAFSCLGRGYGYYADVDNQCQIYHICYKVLDTATNLWHMTRASFYCSEGTIFDQEKHTCMHQAESLPCSEAVNYYTRTMSRFAPPTTWSNNNFAETSRSNLYVTEGGQQVIAGDAAMETSRSTVIAPTKGQTLLSGDNYAPLASTRLASSISYPVKGHTMQQRSVDGVKGGPSRIEYATKGGQSRIPAPEPVYAVKGQTRAFAPEPVYAAKGQSRAILPEPFYPVKGTPSRIFESTKGQTRTIPPTKTFVPYAPARFESTKGQTRAILPEPFYPVKGGVPLPASRSEVKGQSSWMPNSRSNFGSYAASASQTNFQTNKNLPLSPAMRLGVQKNA